MRYLLTIILSLAIFVKVYPVSWAEWDKFIHTDHFDPPIAYAYTTEINASENRFFGRWQLTFISSYGQELRLKISRGPFDPLPRCADKSVTAKSKVDGVVIPIRVVRFESDIKVGGKRIFFERAEGVVVLDSDKWHDKLSSANHLRVRIIDSCDNKFDMEFDVSGIPDLSPIYAR